MLLDIHIKAPKRNPAVDVIFNKARKVLIGGER